MNDLEGLLPVPSMTALKEGFFSESDLGEWDSMKYG